MTLKTGRSSIFETFLKSAAKDESQSGSQVMPSSESGGDLHPSLMLGRMLPKDMVSVLLPDEEEFEAEQGTTLWMSCSPGHDSSDNDAESLAVDVVDVSSDDDDPLPTSQLTDRSSLFKRNGCWSLDGHGLGGQSSTKCNPKPKLPLSPYALFYNDAKAAIVEGNPKAKFAKIAKIVATMWDRLDEETKEDYKTMAKRRNLAKSSTSSVSRLDQDTQIRKRVRKVAKSSLDQKGLAQRRKCEHLWSKKFSRKEKLSKGKEIDVKFGVALLCRRPDCLNSAVDDPRWAKDYCSSHCVVAHCKDVFSAWVSERHGIFQNM